MWVRFMVIAHVTRILFVVDSWILIEERLILSILSHLFEISNMSFDLRLDIC